jgi:hypothetical protein
MLQKNTRKATYLCEEATFSYWFGIPSLLASIREPDFQQFHTSSRPGWYCQMLWVGFLRVNSGMGWGGEPDA